MAEEIISQIDFSPLLLILRRLFKKDFSAQLDSLMQNIERLCDANFKCYQANMRVISIRNSSILDHEMISNCELIARTVGERRVYAKYSINKIIGDSFSTVKTSSGVFDDIIYSIGEMVDRLSIEYIKQSSFGAGDREKIVASRTWSDRVLQCLKHKLRDIQEKGFYEYLKETRTYQLKGMNESAP